MSCKYVYRDGKTLCSLGSHSPNELSNDEFCCFHLPYDGVDVRGKKKEDWSPQDLKRFEQFLHSLILEASSKQNPLNLSGTKIPIDLRMNSYVPDFEISDADIKGALNYNISSQVMEFKAHSTHFHNSFELLSGGGSTIDLNGSVFTQDISLEAVSWKLFSAQDCAFNSNLMISSSTFNVCNLNNIDVQGHLNISNNCTFSELLNFSGNTINEGSTISNVKVSGASVFDGTSIPDNMHFNGCNFGNNSSFRGFKTGKDVTFSNCHFGGNSSFTKKGRRTTEFGKKNHFQNTHILNDSDLTDCKFGVGFKFDNGSIGDGCIFSGAKFGSQTKFSNVTINGASFSDATFENIAAFDTCTFENRTNFSGIRFIKTTKGSGPISFDKCVFHGKTKFNGSKFDGPVSFKFGSFDHVDFSDCVFSDNASFLNRTFEDTTSFKNSIFEVSPKFHGATLHQDTDFVGTAFNDTSSASAAAAYRTLRHAMEQQRSKRNQSKFYALELRSATNSREIEGAARALSILYGLFCNYGLRTGAPAIWLIGMNILFSAVYWFIGRMFDHSQYLTYFKFMMEQLVRPFYVWTGAYKPSEELRCIWGEVSLGFQLLATLQSLISIGLITLLVLAIRRQFKMD